MTREKENRKPDMVTAAVVSSRWVPRIRPAGRSRVSCTPPLICGITATPVSNPDSPSASLGNTISASATAITGSPWAAERLSHQFPTTAGWVAMRHRPVRMTAAFTVRNPATRTTARPMTSRNPRRKTSTRPRIRTSVTPSW